MSQALWSLKEWKTLRIGIFIWKKELLVQVLYDSEAVCVSNTGKTKEKIENNYPQTDFFSGKKSDEPGVISFKFHYCFGLWQSMNSL